MRTFQIAVLCMLMSVGPAWAEEARTEISVATVPPPVPAPPRGCVKTEGGAVLPVPRSDGEAVDMTACAQPGPQDQAPAE